MRCFIGLFWTLRTDRLPPRDDPKDPDVVAAKAAAPSEVDVDGPRGVLAWAFELAAGEKKAVQLDHVISWPEGKQLQ